MQPVDSTPAHQSAQTDLLCAPQGDLKEGVQWPEVYGYLTSVGTRPQMIEASDAYARSRKG